MNIWYISISSVIEMCVCKNDSNWKTHAFVSFWTHSLKEWLIRFICESTVVTLTVFYFWISQQRQAIWRCYFVSSHSIRTANSELKYNFRCSGSEYCGSVYLTLKKSQMFVVFSQTFEQRQVTHLQFLSWPDYGVPSSALSLIDFLGAVKHQQQWAVQAFGSQWRGHPLGPPMVVHCSAGIGRTGQ